MCIRAKFRSVNNHEVIVLDRNAHKFPYLVTVSKFRFYILYCHINTTYMY